MTKTITIDDPVLRQLIDGREVALQEMLAAKKELDWQEAFLSLMLNWGRDDVRLVCEDAIDQANDGREEAFEKAEAAMTKFADAHAAITDAIAKDRIKQVTAA